LFKLAAKVKPLQQRQKKTKAKPLAAQVVNKQQQK